MNYLSKYFSSPFGKFTIQDLKIHTEQSGQMNNKDKNEKKKQKKHQLKKRKRKSNDVYRYISRHFCYRYIFFIPFI